MVSVLNNLWPYRPGTNSLTEEPIRWGQWEEISAAEQYRVLRAYYDSNGLYSTAQQISLKLGLWQADRKPLRNPTYRVVEFYAAKVWGGRLEEALAINTDVPNETLVDSIKQVWQWSNWASRKQVAIRWLAIYGDLFIKVVTTIDKSRVYFELLQPEYVTDFSVDVRGYIVECRIDIPIVEHTPSGYRTRYHTEYWSKSGNVYQEWNHSKGPNEPLARLGDPIRVSTLSEFGIDFVPIVHTKFRDVGDLRGLPAIWPAIEKIDEANLVATRLHQMVFRHNKVTHVLEANMVTPSGQPLPPPNFSGDAVTRQADGSSIVQMGDESFLRLPGLSKLVQLVPNLNYNALLDVLVSQIKEIKDDLPELAYHDLRDLAQVSGIAVRRLLGDAIDRAEEAQGNADDGLQRADMMAITIGIAAGLFDKSLGTFEGGQFAHRFRHRPIISLDESDEAAINEVRVRVAASALELGTNLPALRLAFPDWSEDALTEWVIAREEQQAAAIGQMTTQIEALGVASGGPDNVR